MKTKVWKLMWLLCHGELSPRVSFSWPMQTLQEGPTGLWNRWCQHVPLLGVRASPLPEPVNPCLPVSLSGLIEGFKDSSLTVFPHCRPDFHPQLTSFAPPLKFLSDFLLKDVKFVSIIYFGKVHWRNLVLDFKFVSVVISHQKLYFFFLKTTEFLLVIVFGHFIALKSVYVCVCIYFVRALLLDYVLGYRQ